MLYLVLAIDQRANALAMNAAAKGNGRAVFHIHQSSIEWGSSIISLNFAINLLG
jgi:hypothetical protein